MIDAACSSGAWDVGGIVDRGPAERTRTLHHVPLLGSDEAFLASLDDVAPEARPALVVGIGSVGAPDARRAVVAAYDRVGAGPWAVVVHAAAWVSAAAVLGPGTVVLAHAVVNAGARIGAHAIINSGSVVEHDAVVGAFAHVGPGAVIGGGARLGAGAFAGMGALVRDHVAVGRDAVIGMGAAVTADVGDGVTVVGVPARERPSGGDRRSARRP